MLRNQLGDKVQFKVTQRSSSGVVGEVSVPAVKSDKATATTVVKVTIEACCNSLFVICKSYQYFQQSSHFLLTLFHFVRIHTPIHTYTHKRTHTHTHTHQHTHTHTQAFVIQAHMDSPEVEVGSTHTAIVLHTDITSANAENCYQLSLQSRLIDPKPVRKVIT